MVDIITSGISVMTVEGSLTVDPKRIPKENLVERLNGNTAWAGWGEDNLLPKRILHEIERDTVIFQSTQFNIASHYGFGLNYYREIRTKDGIEKDYTEIPEVADWIEENDASSVFCELVNDYERLGNRIVSCVLDLGRNKIARLLRKDMSWSRWGKQSQTSKRVEKLYVNSDWEGDANNKYGSEFNVLDVFDPIKHLEQLAAKESTGNEFVLRSKMFTTGRYYYEFANPEVIINSGNIEMKDKLKAAYKSLLDNSLGVAYHIHVTEEYCLKQIKSSEESKWKSDPEFRASVQKKIKDKIDKWLTGPANQGKSILTVSYRNDKGELEDGVSITTLDDKIKQDKWLPSMQQYHAESYNAMEVDPSNTGISNKNDGMNSGSEKKNAFFNQKATLGVDRLYTLAPFYTVAKYNGWTKNYRGFKWEVMDEFPHLQPDNSKQTKPATDANK